MSDKEETQKQIIQAAWIVGAVAAVVSAATVAYVFYTRTRSLTPQVESVQQLLDRCHEQVRSIEEKIGLFNDLAAGQTTNA
ncbi:MAG: hypothetical protein SFU56_00760 [Capsulimonadales bacterium]|nr:hypothetical protein [Capsulimonadales bacterium]